MPNFIKKLFNRDTDNSLDEDYAARIVSEREFYAECENVHELPNIFHYWSNKYLVPAMRSFGFDSPDDFFRQRLLLKCTAKPRHTIRAISIGAGNCDLEATIANKLVADGIDNFLINCLELNEDMIVRGRAHANELGVASHIGFIQGDFNRWRGTEGKYDVVIANQSLHHVLALEHLFDAILEALADDGCFLISDMIGRNGHMRWPEALEAMRPFWDELPPAYRYNQLLNRDEPTFINHDCSTSGFEGIRAQDILPLLCERFGFEFFFPYGNIIFPFIDRSFGHNFQAGEDWDRDFIDRVHERDEQGMLEGELTPSSMLGVAIKGEVETKVRDPRLTPQACIRQL